MTGLTLIHQEVFTSDGANKIINLPGSADYIRVLNQTEAAANGTASIDDAFQWEWWNNYALGTCLVTYKENAGNTTLVDENTASKLVYRETVPSPEAAKAATAITAANPAVVTATAHGYSVGDRVVVENNVVMKQIGGMVFTVTAVADANTFTLGYLNASGFAAAETGCNFRRLPADVEVLPGAKFITNITQAANAVVTFSEAHDYEIGDVLYFRVPRINATRWGMVEMDGLEGKVTAITASTVTVDIDSSAFTAFAFAVTGDVPFKFPMAGLAGKRGLYDNWFASNRSLLDLDAFRSGLFVPYVRLAGGAGNAGGAANDVIVVQAFRAM